jgi:hypothetical protein
MADMFDCGRHEFLSWSRGKAHAVRWFGPFDPARTAADQWVISDKAGKLVQSAFTPFERGWNAARAEYQAANAPRSNP